MCLEKWKENEVATLEQLASRLPCKQLYYEREPADGIREAPLLLPVNAAAKELGKRNGTGQGELDEPKSTERINEDVG